MKQYDLLREKITKQASLVLKKFRQKKNSREITNQDFAISLYAYATNNDNISEEKLEILNDRISRLNEFQMRIIRLRFWEGKTNQEIGDLIGKSEGTVRNIIKKCINKMK